MYSQLVAELDRHLVYGVHAFAEDAKLEEARSVDEIAGFYTEHLKQTLPRGSYRLLGWSFGGLLAHKVAQNLVRDGHSVPLLALVDAFVQGDHRPLYPSDMDVWEAFLCFLEGEGQLDLGGEGAPPARIEHGDFGALCACVGASQRYRTSLTPADLQKQFSVFSRHVSSAETYSPDPFAGDVVHYVAGLEPDADRTAHILWPRLVIGDYEAIVLPADHRSILDVPTVGTISRDILERLA